MRNTVHLVTAEDFVSFRPLFQPKIDRDLAGNFGRNLKGVDLAEVRQAARALLAERSRVIPQRRPVPLRDRRGTVPTTGPTTGSTSGHDVRFAPVS